VTKLWNKNLLKVNLDKFYQFHPFHHAIPSSLWHMYCRITNILSSYFYQVILTLDICLLCT
jgi:hypothetical protein